MAIAFRAASTLSYGTRTNSTISKPSGVVDGDVLIMQYVLEGSSPSATAPAGWTVIDDKTINAYGVYYRTWVMRRVASSDGASYTWTHSSAYSSATIAAYSGVDGTTPLDVAPSYNSGTGTSASASSITTVTAGTMKVVLRTSWDGNAISPTSGWTERADGPVYYVQELVQAAAGATGSVTLDSGNYGGVSPWGAWLIALRPASGGSNPGTAALTVPKATLTAAGTQANPGAASLVVPRVALSTSGTQKNPAVAAITVPKTTLAATGQSTNPATAHPVLPRATVTATGQSVNPGSASLAAPLVTIDAADTPVNPGTADLTLPGVTAAASGQTVNPGTANLTLPRITLHAEDTPLNPGAVDVTLARITLAGVGQSVNPAQADLGTPAVTIDAAGESVNPGAAAIATPLITLRADDRTRRNITIRSITEHQRLVTITEHQRVVTITEHPRHTVTITEEP